MMHIIMVATMVVMADIIFFTNIHVIHPLGKELRHFKNLHFFHTCEVFILNLSRHQIQSFREVLNGSVYATFYCESD